MSDHNSITLRLAGEDWDTVSLDWQMVASYQFLLACSVFQNEEWLSVAPAIFRLILPHDYWLNPGDRGSDLPSVAPANFKIF